MLDLPEPAVPLHATQSAGLGYRARLAREAVRVVGCNAREPSLKAGGARVVTMAQGAMPAASF